MAELMRALEFRRLCDGGTLRLELYEIPQGLAERPRVAYRFGWLDDPAPLFAGSDYSPGAGCSVDGDASALGLLGWLTLRPGDTDREYFDDYLPAQWAWATSSACEALSGDVAMAEEHRTAARREDVLRAPYHPWDGDSWEDTAPDAPHAGWADSPPPTI